METVPVVKLAVPNKKCDSYNPFLDDVINPFMNYKPSQKHRKPKIEEKRSYKGCKKLETSESDVHSSTSTIFEEKNPFFIPQTQRQESKSEVVLAAEKCQEDKEDESSTKQSHMKEIIESTSRHNDTLDSLDGLDEVVKELELLALREQELDNEEKKQTCAQSKLKPHPPKRFSSLFKDFDDKIAQEVSSFHTVDAEVDTVTVPLCLSVEIKKRKLFEDRVASVDIPYMDTENIVAEGEIPVSEKHETDTENVLRQVSESVSDTNTERQNENILLLAPDVVITNRGEPTEQNEAVDDAIEYKTIQSLPDMLTHVTESNVLEVNQSLNTSSPINSPDITESYDDKAEENFANISESKTDSASRPAVTSSSQYRYEAPRLRITEPFGENSTEEQVEVASTQIYDSSELQLNNWELPGGDTSHYKMEQQWRFGDRFEQQQLQADIGSRQHIQADMGSRQHIQHTGIQPGEIGDKIGKKLDKKASFFKTLKSRFGFSTKSKKTVEDDDSKGAYHTYHESLDVPFSHFQSSDLPRMTSTPLTRSASTRDSRGVSCNVDRPGTLGIIPGSSDYQKFGGDLPSTASYRTAALKNQHQRWSFAAASSSMYQPNLMLDHILSYNNAMHADKAMHTPTTSYHNTTSYHHTQPYLHTKQYIHTQPYLHTQQYIHTQQYLHTSHPHHNHAIQYPAMTMTDNDFTPPTSVYVLNNHPYGQDSHNVSLPVLDISPIIPPSEGDTKQPTIVG